MGGFLVKRGGEGYSFLLVYDIDPSVTGDTPHCIFFAQVRCILGCRVPSLFLLIGSCHNLYGFHLLGCSYYYYYRGLLLGKGSGALHCCVGLLALCYGVLVLHISYS